MKNRFLSAAPYKIRHFIKHQLLLKMPLSCRDFILEQIKFEGGLCAVCARYSRILRNYMCEP